MNKKLEQVFIIKSYDDGIILSIYATDDAYECERIMSDVDNVCVDDERKDVPVELRKIWKDKCDSDWQYAFERECKRRGIHILELDDAVVYEY